MKICTLYNQFSCKFISQDVSEKYIQKGYCKKEFRLKRTESNDNENSDCDIIGCIEGKTKDGVSVLEKFHFYSRYEGKQVITKVDFYLFID